MCRLLLLLAARACEWLRGVLLSVGLAWAACAQAASYTVAVVPQFPALEIHRTWTPLLHQLSHATGHEFKLVQFASIPEFERCFLRGEADFVFLNPYHMLMAHKTQRYLPLVREKNRLLSGIVVVRAEHPARTLTDLAGETIAYPAPNAFGASLYIRSLLAERRLATQAVYAKTHSNAYRQVMTGQAAAAGGIRSTLEREPEEVRQGLRILFETPPVAPHPLAAHPRIDPAVRRQVIDAWLAMAQQEETQPLLRAVQMPTPTAADHGRDYAPLERLHLEAFVTLDGD